MVSATVGIALSLEDLPIWEEFKNIVRRENKKISTVVMELIKPFVAAQHAR